MGMVGSWGKRTFKVSRKEIRTFTDFRRTTAYKTESVENGQDKPGTARIAPELETLSFNVLLMRGLGVSPKAEAGAWQKACAEGAVYPLYIGGVKQGKHRFLVQSVTQSETTYDARGKLLSCRLAITLQEYVLEMERQQESYESYSGGSGGSGGGSGRSGGSRTVPPSTTEPPRRVVGYATSIGRDRANTMANHGSANSSSGSGINHATTSYTQTRR